MVFTGLMLFGRLIYDLETLAYSWSSQAPLHRPGRVAHHWELVILIETVQLLVKLPNIIACILPLCQSRETEKLLINQCLVLAANTNCYEPWYVSHSASEQPRENTPIHKRFKQYNRCNGSELETLYSLHTQKTSRSEHDCAYQGVIK